MTTTVVQLVIKRLAKSSGVNRLYPHLLRHTYADLFPINGATAFPVGLALIQFVLSRAQTLQRQVVSQQILDQTFYVLG